MIKNISSNHRGIYWPISSFSIVASSLSIKYDYQKLNSWYFQLRTSKKNLTGVAKDPLANYI